MAQSQWGRVRNSTPGDFFYHNVLSKLRQSSVVLCLCLFALAFGAEAGAAPVASAQGAQEQDQAGLVVVHGDGRVVTRCVDLAVPEISGYELLQSSGLDLGVDASGMGPAVCRLDGEGCSPPGESCFCQCMSSPCLYWSYWRLDGGAWSYSNLGASSSTVRAGDVDAWVWGEGIIGVDADNEPPDYTFEDLCAPPTATPTATSTAISTSTATPTPTDAPTALPTATSTAISTATPVSPVETEANTLTPTWTVAPPVATPSATWTPAPVDGHLDGQPDELSEGDASWTAESPPDVRVLSVDRGQIDYGEQAMLVWVVDGAEQVILRYPGGEDAVEAAGSRAVEPALSARYTLIAANQWGETEADVMVFVRPTHTTPTPAAPDSVASAPATPEPATPEAATPEPVTSETAMSVAQPSEAQTSAPEAQAMTEPDAAEPDTAEPVTPSVPAEGGDRVDESIPEATAEPAAHDAPSTTDGSSRLDEETQNAGDAVARVPPVATESPAVAVVPDSAPDVEATDEDSARVRLLALVTGSLLILGGPLLFAFVWIVVWSVWRKT